MITSSGILCDVCNGYILPMLHDDYETFNMKIFDNIFHCHSKCKPLVIKLMNEKTHKHLPEGNLKFAFEEAERKIAEQRTTAV